LIHEASPQEIEITKAMSFYLKGAGRVNGKRNESVLRFESEKEETIHEIPRNLTKSHERV